MSTATIPFLLRRGNLPFCASEIPSPPRGMGWDSVDLIDDAGDAGAKQAIRLYWLLERIQWVPVGPATIVGYPRSFTKTFSGPLPDTSGLDSFTMNGSIVGNVTFTSTSTAFVEPASRICAGSDEGLIYRHGIGYITQTSDISLALVYESSKWRLYYIFNFVLDLIAGITNQSAPLRGMTLRTTGNVLLDGLSLNWASYANASYTDSGFGLSLTDSFLTPAS